jgi:hypothetical protein
MAARAEEIRGFLEGLGFKPTRVYVTLFRLTKVKSSKVSMLLVSLYNNDRACYTMTKSSTKALKEKYKLSYSGELHWHLGIKFT